jgi:hypothetical protein
VEVAVQRVASEEVAEGEVETTDLAMAKAIPALSVAVAMAAEEMPGMARSLEAGAVMLDTVLPGTGVLATEAAGMVLVWMEAMAEVVTGTEVMAALEEASEAQATLAVQVEVAMAALAGMAVEVQVVGMVVHPEQEGEVHGGPEQQGMVQEEAQRHMEEVGLEAWVDMAMQHGEQLGLV